MMVTNPFSEYNIVLASKSPRRKELIKGLDINYTVADGYDVDESIDPKIEINKVAKYLSDKKAREYPFELTQSDIILTSDTIVIVGDKILGKPKDKQEAFDMLKSLSAREHKVVTAVTLRNLEQYYTFDEITTVFFAELSDEDIYYYIDNYSPYDKAGSYGIQEWIGYVAIERIEGSFYNVMGLPVCRLYKELKQFINKIS